MSEETVPREMAARETLRSNPFQTTGAPPLVVADEPSEPHVGEPRERRATSIADEFRNFDERTALDDKKESVGMVGTVDAAGTASQVQVLDAALVTRAQAGDEAAFGELFSHYNTQIYNYIYRMMGTSEDAYDLTQDTFLKAWLALPKTSEDLRVAAWLYRIATNVCLDQLRHRRLIKWQPWDSFLAVFHPTQVAKDSPEKDMLKRENAEEVQLILSKMHPKYRMCLILREYHDLSYDEIALALNTTRAAVKSLLFRAREEFRQVYARAERQPGQVKS